VEGPSTDRLDVRSAGIAVSVGRWWACRGREQRRSSRWEMVVGRQVVPREEVSAGGQGGLRLERLNCNLHHQATALSYFLAVQHETTSDDRITILNSGPYTTLGRIARTSHKSKTVDVVFARGSCIGYYTVLRMR